VKRNIFNESHVKNLQMADLRSLVLIQAAVACAAAETSDRTSIDKQIKRTKSGGAGFAAKPLAIPRCCRLAHLLFAYYVVLSIRLS